MKSDELKAKIEIIMDEMDNFSYEKEELEKRASSLDSDALQLKKEKELLLSEQKKMEEEKIRMEAERKAVVAQAVANAKMKEEIDKSRDSLKILGEAINENKLLEEKNRADLELIEIKRKELESLQSLKDDLEKRESILAKEKAVIRESNRILDIRRDKIKAREQQLQIEAEIE